jgi:acetyl esterase/lipase
MGLSTRTCTYKVVGDCKIQADVYAAGDGGLHPVVIWIHGGALIMGHRGNIAGWQRGIYLDAGYTVVSIDHRLAPETRLPAIIQDVQDAFRWVREAGPRLFDADSTRIAAIGHSAGGYLALMAGFCVEPRPKAVVSFYGYGDIIAPWYSRPDPFYCRQPLVTKEEACQAVGQSCISETPGQHDRWRFYLYCRQQGLWPREVASYDPETEPAAFHPFCPVRNVTRDYPPTLLLHGDQDTDVPYQQSVMMAEALAQAGVEHELITIPNGGHGFDGSGGPVAADAFDRVLSFLDAHLQ